MPHELWSQLVSQANRTLSQAQAALLDRYLDLLLDANTRMNLTRIIDRQQAAVAHVGDALTLLPFLPATPFSLVDIGSGGGVPGVPLAIVLPDCQITLVESTGKKAGFLSDCATQLGLSNLKVLPLRAEEVGRGNLRETIDIVTARAVGELSFLIEWGAPLLKKHGKILALKGAKAQQEIDAAPNAIKLLHMSPPTITPVALPGADNHVIVTLIKEGRTEPKYPRSATTAKSRPLG